MLGLSVLCCTPAVRVGCKPADAGSEDDAGKQRRDLGHCSRAKMEVNSSP